MGNFRNPRGANLDMQNLGPNGALRMFRSSGPKAREFGKPFETLGIFALQKKFRIPAKESTFRMRAKSAKSLRNFAHLFCQHPVRVKLIESVYYCFVAESRELHTNRISKKYIGLTK